MNHSASKPDEQEKTDSFFENHRLSRFTQEAIDTLKWAHVYKRNSSKGPLMSSISYLRRKFYQMSYKLFRELEAERKLLYSFFEANITLVHFKSKDIT